MNTDSPGNAHDVVLVADFHSHLPPALELAIALAGRRRVALRGLFIEDSDLATVSALPFLQEVTLTGARPRALEQRRLHRSLDSVSRRFHRLLAESAEGASLTYSFGTVSGRRQALALGSEVDAGYLVLGQPGPIRESRHRALRVLLAQVDLESALPVLECLQSIRRERQLELLVLANGEADGVDTRLAEFLSQHAEVACQHLPAGRLLEVFRRTGHPPELVITSRHCSPAVLQPLLQLSACPVILATQESGHDNGATAEDDRG